MEIVLVVIVFILLAYLYFLKREIKSISKQLSDYNYENTRKKIDIKLFDKNIEELSKNINTHIDIHIQSSVKQMNTEEEMKRAIANISHDIRTPLTSILGYIQMSQKEGISDLQRKECIKIAEKRSKILKEILEKFFELSIIQSPEYKIDIEYVNLNNMLYEVISSTYDKFKEKQIEPKIDIKKENVIIVGNKMGINRIIDNLISNLVKYSNGGESIKLDQKDGKAVLLISNNTKDLKKEDIECIFDRFYKQDISRSSSESSGLGLAITKKLIESMDGSVNVQYSNNRIEFICKWNLR